MTAKALYTLDATVRVGQGKGASRRLRRMEDRVPAILYGGKEAPTIISLDHKKVMHALENPKIFSNLLTLNLDGNQEQVVFKAIQRHHHKKGVLHIDFLRVKPTDVLVMKVPIIFVGAEQAPGVKDGGGIVNHQMNDIEIRCQAKNLPESITVDVSQMELDQTIHISHLKFPAGVESVVLSHGPEHDHPVVSVHLPKVIVEEEPVVATETTEEGAEGTAAAPGAAGGAASAKAPAASAKGAQPAPAGKGAQGASQDKDKGKGKK